MKAESIDEVLALFTKWGEDPYDEELSQLTHALQTAALARASGADAALITAALLHDVGHLLELSAGNRHDSGIQLDLQHEASGPDYLADLFGPDVIEPIRLHVAAKRYRCAKDEAYLTSLSTGSTASLALQGGPMNPAEVETFESFAYHDDAVALRGWDDGGKQHGLEVPGLDAYREVLQAASLSG